MEIVINDTNILIDLYNAGLLPFCRIAMYQGVCNLSPEDISVMVYAIDNDCRLLTGDKKLRDKAMMENIKVSGVLYITDLLTKEGIIEKEEMASALERLLKSNNRLPKRLIKERIEALRK